MKPSIYLINPQSDMPSFHGGDVLAANGFSGQTYFADLVIVTVAAFVPADWQIRLCDENIDSVDFESNADFIGITGKVSQFGRMQEIAAEFRRRGKTVLIGGPYASLVPDTVRPHCDILVRGEIENLAPRLFADLESGQWQREYLADTPSLTASPIPRWDLYPNERSLSGAVQTSRGCPFSCEYCDVIAYAGRKQRYKSPEQVIQELDVLYAHGYRSVFLVDDNLTANKRQAEQLLIALRDWNQRQTEGRVAFTTQLSIEVSRRHDLLQLCQEAGLCLAFIGIETPNLEGLREAHKPQNLQGDLVEQVNAFLAHGISVMAGMIIGFDADDSDCFERMYEFVTRSAMPICSIGNLVAMEATPLYSRLQQEGRIKDSNRVLPFVWYSNIVHPRITEEQMDTGFRWLINRLYNPEIMTERLLAFIERLQVTTISDAREPRLIERSSQALINRLANMGLGEKRMLIRVERALAKKPEAASLVYASLMYYLQLRYIYESAGVWEPNLGVMMAPKL